MVFFESKIPRVLSFSTFFEIHHPILFDSSKPSAARMALMLTNRRKNTNWAIMNSNDLRETTLPFNRLVIYPHELNSRVLEKEIMLSEEEVVAYDLLVGKYSKILHAGFVETVINLSPPKGRFLDIGTGTGWIAIGVAKNSSDIEITAVDLSEIMLAVARRNAQRENVTCKVIFKKGDAKGLPLRTELLTPCFVTICSTISRNRFTW